MEAILDALFISSRGIETLELPIDPLLPSDVPVFLDAIRRFQQPRTLICSSAIIPRLPPHLAAVVPSLQSLSLSYSGMPLEDLDKFSSVLDHFQALRSFLLCQESSCNWSHLLSSDPSSFDKQHQQEQLKRQGLIEHYRQEWFHACPLLCSVNLKLSRVHPPNFFEYQQPIGNAYVYLGWKCSDVDVLRELERNRDEAQTHHRPY